MARVLRVGVGILEEATTALPLWWRYICKKTPTTPRACSFVGYARAADVIEAQLKRT